ncbi:FMRFamide receptor-like [Lineus longissimus]|uniref:FMRFamide receptor-like n=1 Tax=Lineus longissimus TaxID=88925 RepID=UPI00315CBD70
MDIQLANETGGGYVIQNVIVCEDSSMEDTGNETEGDSAGFPPAWWHVSRFIVDVVIVGIMILIGFIGNMLSFVVLHKDKNWSTTHFLLQCLALADTLFLCGCMMFQTLFSIKPYLNVFEEYHEVFPYILPYLYPLGLMAQTARNWITVTVTVDRFIAIRFPLKSNRISTIKNMRITVTFVVIGAILFNIPRFFASSVEEQFDACTNTTSIVNIENEKFSKSPTYRIFYGIVLYFIFIVVGPLLLLVILNINLMVIIHRSNKQRSRMAKVSPNSQKADVNRMLISVISVFIICEAPSVVYQVLWMTNSPQAILIMPFTNMLVTLNSSINFFIYCLAGQKFRKILRSICCGSKHRWRKLNRNGNFSRAGSDPTLTHDRDDRNSTIHEHFVVNNSSIKKHYIHLDRIELS